MAETLNAAAKENLPLLFIVIDNGRAINTFTPDVATNSNVFDQGLHYGVPGIKVRSQKELDSFLPLPSREKVGTLLPPF